VGKKEESFRCTSRIEIGKKGGKGLVILSSATRREGENSLLTKVFALGTRRKWERKIVDHLRRTQKSSVTRKSARKEAATSRFGMKKKKKKPLDSRSRRFLWKTAKDQHSLGGKKEKASSVTGIASRTITPRNSRTA